MDKLVFCRFTCGHHVYIWFDEARERVSIEFNGELVAEIRVDESGVVVYTPATKEDLEDE